MQIGHDGGKLGLEGKQSAQWGVVSQARPVRSAGLGDSKEHHDRVIAQPSLLLAMTGAARRDEGRGKNRKQSEGVRGACWELGIWSLGEELPAQCPLLLGPNPKALWEMFIFKYQLFFFHHMPNSVFGSQVDWNTCTMPTHWKTHKYIALFWWVALGKLSLESLLWSLGLWHEAT